MVGTPIGNLEDITRRAARVLGAVDLIAAEDTRRTRQLLAHLQIQKPLVSCHEFSEARQTPALLAKLSAGQQVALVTDAGMPTISDPGLRLIQASRAAGLPIEIVPGVSAVTTAVAGAGLRTGQFLFYGFLPPKSTQRRKVLQRLAPLSCALVFFESPYRIRQSVSDMAATLGNRRATICRELTKRFEEWLRGDLESLGKSLENRRLKGEITVVVEGDSES